MKLPEPIDTTALATYQDQVLARTDWGHGRARAHLINLSKWDLMLSSLPTSNLRIRQTLIQAGLNHILGEPLGQAHEIARKMFDELRRDGLWVEGPDYMEYSAVAVEWYCNVVGVDTVMQDHIAEMRYNYLNLVAPDGTIPVPEARDTKYTSPYADNPLAQTHGTMIDTSTPTHTVKRWPSGAYLLVCLDTNPEPRGNFHYHLAAGYFALWCNIGPVHLANRKRFADKKEFDRWCSVGSDPNGNYRLSSDADKYPVTVIPSIFGWAARCLPYTGWDPKTVATDNGLQQLLPPGALLPTWRLKPPRVTVTRIENGVRIEWKNPWMRKSTRTLTWGNGKVRCVDAWSWFGKKVREWTV